MKKLLLTLALWAFGASAFAEMPQSTTAPFNVSVVAPNFSVDPNSSRMPAGAGTNYAQGDSIVLADGCAIHAVLVVKAITGSTVTQANLSQPGSCLTRPANPVGQLSTSGSGSGATFNIIWGHVATSLAVGALTNLANGSLYINADTNSGFYIYGGENTFIGDKAGGGFAGATAFSTCIGHNSCGTGSGIQVNGQSVSCFGTDCLRNMQANNTSLGQFTDDDLFGYQAAQNLGLGQPGIQANKVAGFGTGVFGNLLGGNNGNESISGFGQFACKGAANAAFYHGSCFGTDTGGALTTAHEFLILSGGNANVGNMTFASGSGVILIGSGAQTVDTPAAATSNYINLENVFSVTGTNTPSTSVATHAGPVMINAVATSTGSLGMNGDIILIHPLTPSAAHDARTNISLGFNSLISFSPISTSEYMTCLGFETCSSLTTADHNTAVGAWALASITTQTNNTGLGIDALRSMTAGASSVGIGEHALALATTSNSSTALGVNALFNALTATQSVALGTSALQGNASNTWTSSDDVSIGYQSMFAANGTFGNTATGWESLFAITTGTNNTATGRNVLSNLTTGTFNTANGDAAGAGITTGSNNVFVGASTNSASGATASAVCIGLSTKCGTSDVAIGANAQHAISSTNASNTAVGNFALFADTNGTANVALGNLAGSTITTGSNDLILGPNVGKTTIATGSSNVLIGTSASVDTPTSSTSNYLNIQGVLIATGTNTPSTSVSTISGSLVVGGASSVQVSALTATLPIYTDVNSKLTSTAPTGYPAVNTGSVSCGTGCASVTGSGSRFTITGGTGISSIVVNFGTTWGTTPVCTVSDNSTTSASDVSALSTTSITVGLSVALTGATVYVLCSG